MTPVITGAIRLDGEYRHVLDEYHKQAAAKRPLPLLVNGLSGGGTDAFCAALAADAGGTVVFLVPDEREAARLTATLTDAGVYALAYDRRDFVLYPISASHDHERERLFVLSELLAGRVGALVTTPAAALQYTCPPDVLEGGTLTLRAGSVLSPADLQATLSRIGYARVDAVDGAGQFSARGGIVDVFVRAATEPVRMEFFGDEIDRLGYFDPLTQRVGGVCDALTILPAREVVPDEGALARMRTRVENLLRHAEKEEARQSLAQELAQIDGGMECAFADKYIRAVYDTPATLLTYLSLASPRPVVFLGTNAVTDSLRASLALDADAMRAHIDDGLISGDCAAFGGTDGDLDAFLAANVPIHLNTFSSGLTSMRAGGLFGFRCRTTVTYDKNLDLLAEDLENYVRSRFRVAVVTSGESESRALAERMEGRFPVCVKGDLTAEEMEAGIVYFVEGKWATGYELILARTAIVTTNAAEGAPGTQKKKTRRARTHAKKKNERILSYAELAVGDYVVHDAYGIGRFGGMQTMTVQGVTRDFIVIHYAGKDKLFLPADNLESISKYIGAKSEDGLVKLSKFGGTDWQKSKSRARGAAKEMAHELITLYAARERRPGIAFPSDDEYQQSFDDSFEFEETESQITAIDEIKADMEKPRPMDRLLCGDVGFGKTEVAFRAVFKAFLAGYQSALLVPTTILALQHYQTALSRMRGYPIKIEMISRFRSQKECAEVLRRLRRGDVDLIIGTHKLLGRDIEFKNLGLLVVDEEQRFGVAQKEKLKALAGNVDVLTLTATPIPRTLNMAMSGIRDISLLDEAPADRYPVQTYVLEHNDVVIGEAIRRELARHGQVLYLHNFTDSIDATAHRLSSAFPEARVAVAHGKMDREEIEDVWQAMVRGEIDILVCTTIVETGIDLPNANTLIIENADRMGLSQLHQLRGRVGRSSRHAYAYFTYRQGKALTEIATKRLEAMREYAEFGAGFKIALRDLEIRGAGDLLGAEQHGHIDSVGYDLYIRLLNDAILEEKGTAPAERFESRVDIPLDANIPESYIPAQSQRMEMYKKISLIECAEDWQDVCDEFCDRFGDMPAATERLLHVALARSLASKHRISLIELREGTLAFLPESPDMAAWSEVFAEKEGLRMTARGTKTALVYRLERGEDGAKSASEILQLYDRMTKEAHE